LAFTITTVSGITTIVGTDGRDTGAFAQTDVVLQAFADQDVVTLTGAQGGASVKMGDGEDTLTANIVSTNSTYKLNKGADLAIFGATAGGTIAGGKGSDTITTGALTNFATLQGGKGSDNITVGAASSNGIQVFGGRGNDSITAGAAVAGVTASAIYGGDGDDLVNAAGAAGQVDWAIYGDGGDDTLNGGDGQNAIYGGTGDDSITGGGVLQNNSLSGGSGTNTFNFATPTGVATAANGATIIDWTAGTNNVIDFTANLTKYANVTSDTLSKAGFVTTTVTINANGVISGATSLANAASAFDALATAAAATGGVANGTAIYSDGVNTYLFVNGAVAGGVFDRVQVNSINATNFTVSGGNVTAFS